MRPGRPPTYTAEQRGEVIAAALTDRPSWACPSARWTLDRLLAYLSEQGHRACGAAGSTRSSWPRACGGGSRRPGSASGSIPTSPKKGGHRAALHRAARGQRRRLPRRDGAGGRPRAIPGSSSSSRRAAASRRAGQAGDRLRPARARATSSAPSGRPPARRSPRPTRPHARPTGSTSWSEVEAWIARESSGSTPIAGQPQHPQRARDVLLFAWPIRAGSSSSSRSTRPT